MNTTTDPQTPGVTPKQRQILGDLVWIHNNGKHKDRPNPGCAGCLLSGALETEGE